MTSYSVGDRVELPSGEVGTVVGVIERREFARNLEAWRHAAMPRGLIVLLDEGMFVNVDEPGRGVRPAPHRSPPSR